MGINLGNYMRHPATLLAFLLSIHQPGTVWGSEDWGVTVTVGSITMLTAGSVGFGMAVTNGVIAARGHRPHLAVRILDLVAGATNLGLSGFWFHVRTTMTDRTSRNAALGFALGHLAIGMLDAATVAWGWTRPPAVRRVVWSPLILPDAAGHVTLGGQVAIGSW